MSFLISNIMLTYPKIEDLDLVALDLDGTVMCAQGQAPVSRRTRAAVRALQERKLPVTFVTGRTEDYAKPLALEFALIHPLVTYNGARLFCPHRSEILFESNIESKVASAISKWLGETDEVVASYLTRDGALHLFQSRCSGDPRYDDYLFGTPRSLVDSLGLEIEKGGTVSKLIVLTQRPLEQDIAERFGAVVQVVRTHPDLIEILPLGVSKGQGVLRLCQILNVDPARVLAIGDQENDISTFQICGYSVAMGEAPNSVKEAADFVTGTFEEDGCAQALEKLIRRTL